MSDGSPITTEIITRWIHLFHEKRGFWPTMNDLDVWDKVDDEWVKLNESWPGISKCLTDGHRGLPKSGSLSKFKSSIGIAPTRCQRTGFRWLKQQPVHT